MTQRYHSKLISSEIADTLRINAKLAALDEQLTTLRDGTWLWMNRTTEPDSPASGYRFFFLDDYLYKKDSGGTALRLDVLASYAHLADVKVNGTAGGTSAGGWQTRDLNTVVSDDDGIITALAANQFTLETGTYTFRSWSPSWGVLDNQLALYDTTAAAFIQQGLNGSSRTAETGLSFCMGEFTLAVQSVLELQMNAGVGVGADVKNFGYPASITDEVYTQIILWKQPG